MLGAIVLSEFNEIVHTFGNTEFRRFATRKTLVPCADAIDESSAASSSASSASAEADVARDNASRASSTTSGVASSSADSLRAASEVREAPIAAKSKASDSNADFWPSGKPSKRSPTTGRLKTFRKYKLDRDSLLERVLPLVIIYRMNQEALRNGTTAARRERSGGGAATAASDWLRDSRLSRLFADREDLRDAVAGVNSDDADDDLDAGLDAEGAPTGGVPLRFRLKIDGRDLRFGVGEYDRSFVVVFVCSVEICSVTFGQFQRTVARCLDFHYGPTVQLLDAGYGGVREQLQERAERRVERLADAAASARPPLFNDAFNANVAYGNSASVEALMTVFRELTARVAQTLARKCRCIFVNCGQIIASMCSEERVPTLLDAYDADALTSLLEFALQDAYGGRAASMAADMPTAAAVATRHCLKCQVEQAWLRSRQLAGRRQYLNVHVFSLTGEVELICLSNAHHAGVVSVLTDVLAHIGAAAWEPLLTSRTAAFDTSAGVAASAEFRQYQTDCAHAINAGEALLERLFVSLRDFKLPPADVAKKSNSPNSAAKSPRKTTEFDDPKYIYLSNLERTKKLIRNQWKRLCENLSLYLRQISENRNAAFGAGAQHPSNASFSYYYCSFPTSMRASLARLGSSLSLLSTNSSTPAAGCGDASVYATVRSTGATSDETGFRSAASRRSAPRSSIAGARSNASATVGAHHLNAMLTQLRRVLRGLLKELVECSYALARSQQLQPLHTMIRQSVDQRLTTQLRTLLANVVAVWQDGSPLRPLRLGLDALAYCVARTDVPINYNFVPNEYRSIFCRLSISAIESDFVIARSDDGKLLIQVAKTDESTPPVTTTTGKKLRFSSDVAPPAPIHATTCIAVYPECVNITLALRQTYQLINAFDPQIHDVASRIK